MSQTQAGARCKSTKLRREQLQAYKALYPTAYSFVRCGRGSLRSLRFRRVSLAVMLTLESALMLRALEQVCIQRDHLIGRQNASDCDRYE